MNALYIICVCVWWWWRRRWWTKDIEMENATCRIMVSLKCKSPLVFAQVKRKKKKMKKELGADEREMGCSR